MQLLPPQLPPPPPQQQPHSSGGRGRVQAAFDPTSPDTTWITTWITTFAATRETPPLLPLSRRLRRLACAGEGDRIQKPEQQIGEIESPSHRDGTAHAQVPKKWRLVENCLSDATMPHVNSFVVIVT